MKIAVSDCGKPEKQRLYVDWLKSFRPEAEFVTVSYRTGAADLSGFDGLVLTGGEDVDAGLSKAKPAELVEPGDRKRDDFEFALLRQSAEGRLPVLGICRGMQTANVFFGGTLVADLPFAGFRPHTSVRGAGELRHRIHVAEGTLLNGITASLSGEINSYHHQSVLEPAEDLIVSAYSEDRVAEAMEWKVKEGKPFLLLVQWHPERMTDRENPFTGAVASALFTAIEVSQTKK